MNEETESLQDYTWEEEPFFAREWESSRFVCCTLYEITGRLIILIRGKSSIQLDFQRDRHAHHHHLQIDAGIEELLRLIRQTTLVSSEEVCTTTSVGRGESSTQMRRPISHSRVRVYVLSSSASTALSWQVLLLPVFPAEPSTKLVSWDQFGKTVSVSRGLDGFDLPILHCIVIDRLVWILTVESRDLISFFGGCA